MARRRDDKRVLRAGNGRDNSRKRRLPTHFRNNNRNNRRQNNYSRNNHKQKKSHSGKTVLLMILILLAFIIGAGSGVLLSFDDGNSTEQNQTYVQNVTVEMTSNLNNTTEVVFEEADQVDFNENQSSEILGAEENPYYDYSQLQQGY
ncbi:hypothetical protein [Methanobrevibacter sp.]|uniref:hypothetical protein n=1 Tax=Methanobrevibacter sp. TaxID=66852 RepID=UPI00388E539E